MITVSEKASQLIDYIRTAILVFDQGLTLTYINAAGENLLSVSQRKALGLPARTLLPEIPEFVETIERSFLSRQAFTQWGLELPVNGVGTLTFDTVVTPVIEGENCREIIVELIDARSFTRALKEENLINLHDAARKSLQGMAHEVKNPLGGLRGAAQLLERELDDSELTEYTQIIISEADRLRNLVDRMLTPNIRHEPTQVNVHQILDYVHSVVEAELDTSLKVERDYDPSLPNLLADREQLIQAFLNMFKNAGEAVGSNGEICLRTRIKRKCTIRQHTYKLAMQIEIIDDGPGIPSEIESEIFYPLITGRANGTGLGLSIAQSLIQLHGGMIEYERADNKTIFRTFLPLDEAHV